MNKTKLKHMGNTKYPLNALIAFEVVGYNQVLVWKPP